MAQFVLVFGGHDLHVGNQTHKCDIENAMLRLTVLANDTGAIQREDDVQVLHADIVDHLIEGALHEGRVNGGNGTHPGGGQPGGESDAVLFGNAHVEIAFGETLVQLIEASSLGHGGGNTDDGLVCFGQT